MMGRAQLFMLLSVAVAGHQPLSVICVHQALCSATAVLLVTLTLVLTNINGIQPD
jgi:hypothetical protein